MNVFEEVFFHNFFTDQLSISILDFDFRVQMGLRCSALLVVCWFSECEISPIPHVMQPGHFFYGKVGR